MSVSVRDFLQRPRLAHFPFVFVVTFGRSGSTLLQGILNSISGYCIRGENNSSLFYLFVASQKYQEAHRNFGNEKTDARSPWFGADTLNPEAFSQALADVFLTSCLRPSEDARCVGFKEIRYTPEHIPDDMFAAYLDFLQTVFPGAALIFNVRRVTTAMGSGWWGVRNHRSVKRLLEETVERFQSYGAGRHNCFSFNYDSLVADPMYCEALFEFLGEPFDREKLDAILAQEHSLQGRQQLVKRKLEAKSAELKVKSAELKAKSAELARVEKALLRMGQRTERLRASVAAAKNSTSWKITAPLRRLRLAQQNWFRKPKVKAGASRRAPDGPRR